MKQFLVLAAVLVCAAPAAAQQPKPIKPQMMMEVEGNVLYVVDWPKVAKVDLSTFEKTATVDIEEAFPERAPAAPKHPIIRRFDRDGDGKVSKKELPQEDLWDRLKRFDQDGDEALSNQELPQFRGGPTTLLKAPPSLQITKSHVLVAHSGIVYRLGKSDLAPRGSVAITEQETEAETAQQARPRPRPNPRPAGGPPQPMPGR